MTDVRNAGGRASASTSGGGTDVRSAGGQASASTSGRGAAVRNAGWRSCCKIAVKCGARGVARRYVEALRQGVPPFEVLSQRGEPSIERADHVADERRRQAHEASIGDSPN